MSGASKGFTLVEMLVALAALSILAGGGMVLTQLAADTRELTQQRSAASLELLRLRSILKSDLEQAAARRARDPAGGKPGFALAGPPFLQGETFLTLVRRGWENPQAEPRSDLQYVEYALREGRIERRWRRQVDGAALEAPQVLLAGVARVEVRYFQYDQWSEAWAGSPARPLPDALSLEIDIEAGGSLRQLFLLPDFAS